MLTPKQQARLRDAVLVIEKEFHQVIEPGRGFAVDVEWALDKGKLYIVQARVITGV